MKVSAQVEKHQCFFLGWGGCLGGRGVGGGGGVKIGSKALTPSGHYLLFPFLLTKSQTPRKNRQANNCIKKGHRTNIIATNFVWDQLKKFKDKWQWGKLAKYLPFCPVHSTPDPESPVHESMGLFPWGPPAQK